MENVKELVKQIDTNRTQRSSSQKDEVAVMRAMLNDKDYKVEVYGKNGAEGTYCPAEEARSMISSVISAAAKIPSAEAEKLAEDYEFKKSEATAMVGISKEFINTYSQTGRKLPLGKRETSDVSLERKHVEEKEKTYPKVIGIDNDGNKIIEKAKTIVKAHDTIKATGHCPEWVK